jgi:RNA 2',3'-cyclic 3'-phosphodiesterase
LRLFIAVVPPDEVLDAVAALPRPETEGLRWTSRDQWHVTLRFLGQVDGVADVTAALAGAALGRCEARLGPEIARFGRRVLQIPATGLDDLAAAVVAATGDIGRPPEDRPFAAHLTLARARARRGVDLRALTGAGFDAAWWAEEVCLVESRLHPHGARYDVVERFRLSG